MEGLEKIGWGQIGQLDDPPRSADLTPLDFFIWGHLKEIVYKTPLQNREDLEMRVRLAINEITELQLENVLRGTVTRIRLCRENNGQHFENLR